MITRRPGRRPLPGRTLRRCERVRWTRVQAEALDRLITLLEALATDHCHCLPTFTHTRRDIQSLRARLRAAHATYMLASSPMQRLGSNAWLRPRGGR